MTKLSEKLQDYQLALGLTIAGIFFRARSLRATLFGCFLFHEIVQYVLDATSMVRAL